MFLRTLLAAGALLGFAASAHAADVYSNSGGLKDSPVSSSAYNWSGFYAGVNAGGGWSQLDSSFTTTNSSGTSGLTINHTNADVGVVGGGQAGYNFQTGAFVVGLEGDFGYLGVSNTSNIITAFAPGNSLALGTKIEPGFLADITARVGYASGPALFYVKGGWAYFDGSVGTSGITALGSSNLRDVSASGLSGWTLGGGIEYLISPSWSIKGEYQHFDFGSVDFHPVISDPTVVIGNTLTADTVKVGLNYHIGGIR
jgi:outer membrane immunogenic protein